MYKGHLYSLIREPTCFKNLVNPHCIDLFLANCFSILLKRRLFRVDYLISINIQFSLLKKKLPNYHLPLLDPRPWPEGSYKIGSVRPSFHLSVSFLRIGSLVFSETQHGVRGPYIVMCDRAEFFRKNLHRAKMTKNGQKCPHKHGFWTF